jgi:hypothetical protein
LKKEIKFITCLYKNKTEKIKSHFRTRPDKGLPRGLCQGIKHATPSIPYEEEEEEEDVRLLKAFYTEELGISSGGL